MKSQDLKEKHSDIWKQNLEHPFLKEIESGDLPIENFKFYMKQDYLYLLEYCKAIALLIAKSETEENMRDYTEVLHKTVNLEIEHHRNYCKEVGIENLEGTEMAPTTAAYTQYLVKTAYSESVPEIISVILPCFWIYLDMGKELDPTDTKEEYREWILMYRSDEFEELIKRLKADLDSYLKKMGEDETQKIDDIFKRSLRYEYMFWDMCYNMEKWDI